MSIFRVPKAAIAMLQLPPLPGTYKYRGETPEQILDQTLEEARLLHEAGFDGLQVQNNGDHPSAAKVGPETVAYMTMIVAALRREFPSLGLGVLCNWDGVAAVAVAHAAGADYVRIEYAYTGAMMTPMGLMNASCHEVTRFQRAIGADRVAITADVFETHGVPVHPQPLADAIRDTVDMGGARGVWLCGRTFAESAEMLRVGRQQVSVPILLGGGARRENVAEILALADGMAVARAIKGGDIFARTDPRLARAFMDEVRRVRGF